MNEWDPLDIDLDMEVLDEEDLPPSSFAPHDEDAPYQSTQDDQAPANSPNTTQQTPQHVNEVKVTTSAQDR